MSPVRTERDCARMRVAASARADGEPLELSAAALDAHLLSCPGCAGWAAEAARITRALRVSTAAVPDLSERILADVRLPARRARRPVTILRVLLLVAAAAQLALALPDIFGTSVGMHMAAHAAHESAAWNAAIGVAFLVTAVRPRLCGGLVPVLAVFVALLAAMSVYDVSTGAVDAARLFTHTACVLGLGLVVTLARVTAQRPDPIASGRGRGAAPVDVSEQSVPPRLRGVA